MNYMDFNLYLYHERHRQMLREVNSLRLQELSTGRPQGERKGRRA
jgi:hypothetical protein